jgi:hypothetical protein
MMRKNTIVFDNGNRAVSVTAPRDANAKSIIDALEITSPRAVILLFGGAAGLDDSRKAHLAILFADAIVPVAADSDALIIDGGTQSGVMEIMGEAVAKCGAACQLLGVAPVGKVAYPGGPGEAGTDDRVPLQPNHSHFVLVESNEWGGETATMLQIAGAFGAPVVAILVNGGGVAADEALRAIRAGWWLFVIEGSGRFADEVSTALCDSRFAKSDELSEIVRSDRVLLFHIDDAAPKVEAELRRMLSS